MRAAFDASAALSCAALHHHGCGGCGAQQARETRTPLIEIKRRLSTILDNTIEFDGCSDCLAAIDLPPPPSPTVCERRHDELRQPATFSTEPAIAQDRRGDRRWHNRPRYRILPQERAPRSHPLSGRR